MAMKKGARKSPGKRPVRKPPTRATRGNSPSRNRAGAERAAGRIEQKARAVPVKPPIRELLLQSLEHELGGVILYRTALECVINRDLKKEWTKYLKQTQVHVEVLCKLCEALGLDPHEVTPGRTIVQHNGKSLAIAMKMALAANDPPAAELVACECIVLAETKDHFDWELIGKCATELAGAQADLFKEAYQSVEDEEDEHLYHTKGWCRELWFKALGFDAKLPPPEERKDVKTAVGAARAEKSRKTKKSGKK